MARQYLPNIAFNFIEGGVEDEACLTRNPHAFGEYLFLPNYLVDVSGRSQKTELLGRAYDSPVGIAPTGGAGMWRRGADLMLAQAAATANVPFILSCASISSVESVVGIAGKNVWFQSYATKDPAIGESLLVTAQASGVETLVVTIDVPVTGKRERNLRNGFTRPLKLTPSIVLDGLLHPRWLAKYLANGAKMPMMENWADFLPAGASADEVLAFYGKQTPSDSQSWEKLERIRDRWKGKLILKGVLSPNDAERAFATGVDGLILSNHGGRQFDVAPPPISILPLVRRAVGPNRLVMIDSGIQRGTDILKAIALGADFAFVGRATLYGVIAGGSAGALRALDILRGEIATNMGILGCNKIYEVREKAMVSRAGETLGASSSSRAEIASETNRILSLNTR